MTPRIAFYITGHGFGHAIRAVTVMKALRAARPDIEICIRTRAPRALIEREVPPPVFLEQVQTDTGGYERSLLFSDPEKTIAVARDFYARIEPIIESEVAFVKSAKIDLVLSDVPPAASEIAARAGVPSVVVANFTWDRIYAEYPESEAIVEQIRGYYEKTTLALEVPLGHPIDVFPRRERIPLIARKAEADAARTRRELGVEDGQVAVLLALKGDETAGRRLRVDDATIRLYTFSAIEGDGVIRLDEEWQTRFPEVLAACDVVLSKPGYGIVSECIANKRPLLHLPREGFLETPFLLEDMEGLIPHWPIGLECLADGSLETVIRDAAEVDHPYPEIRIDGAEVAAEKIIHTEAQR